MELVPRLMADQTSPVFFLDEVTNGGKGCYKQPVNQDNY